MGSSATWPPGWADRLGVGPRETCLKGKESFIAKVVLEEDFNDVMRVQEIGNEKP